MRVVDGVKEVLAFAAEIILSCGPSQIYGLVKGAIDLYKYAQIRSKIHQWQEIQTNYQSKRWDELKNTNAFKKIINYGDTSQTRVNDFDRLNAKAERRLFDLEQKSEQRILSLKKDFVSLIPIIGALFAWRIGAPAEEKSLWHHTPFIPHAVAHALQDHEWLARGALYPDDGEPRDDCHRILERRFAIYVPIGGRTLDAVFLKGKDANPKGPTVVLSHGNGMICHEMHDRAQWYQNRGFNVLMVTMGGYADSPGIHTTEKSCYQDIEAIKHYLDSQGIKHAGYHGLSVGGSLAFQGAVGKTEAKEVKTMFVVAEKTFTSTREVYANFTSNNISKLISSIAEGVGLAATPSNIKVRLSEKLIIETDGLDNKAKAAQMKILDIPLFAIKGNQDDFMGRNHDGRYFKDDFADDLIKARYGEIMDKHLMVLSGGHNDRFYDKDSKLEKFITEARDKALTASAA